MDRSTWDGEWSVGDFVVGSGETRRTLYQIMNATQSHVQTRQVGLWLDAAASPLPFIFTYNQLSLWHDIRAKQFHRRATSQELTQMVTTRILESQSHAGHGSGSSDYGPDDPDCPCRTTPEEMSCALAGCGFCSETPGP